MNFGYLLRTLRICAGLSLRELARSIDVSPTYLSLVENGKQPPPNAARVKKIEEALKVPPGSLLSVARGFDPNLLSFFQAVPEVTDFLNLAKEKNFPAAGFMEMTAFLNVHGSEKFLSALRTAVMPSSQPEMRGKPSSRGLYVWRFLEEDLIFDLEDKSEKDALLQEVVKRLCRHCSGINCEEILNELMRREKVASTGIGRGVAVPHAYVTGLDRMIVILARTPQGVEFNSVDGEPVYLVVLLAGPRSSKNLHLLLLSRVAKLVRNKSFCQKILAAANGSEIISLFQEAETNIP